MKKAEKKIAMAVGSCVLCLLVITAGICAYYISTALKSNAFIVGENVTEIEEDFEPPATIEAGQSYEKRVTVRNVKSVPCYVRVFAEFSHPQQEDAMQLDFNSEDWTTKQADITTIKKSCRLETRRSRSLKKFTQRKTVPTWN